jgi:hypothetical protein
MRGKGGFARGGGIEGATCPDAGIQKDGRMRDDPDLPLQKVRWHDDAVPFCLVFCIVRRRISMISFYDAPGAWLRRRVGSERDSRNCNGINENRGNRNFKGEARIRDDRDRFKKYDGMTIQ